MQIPRCARDDITGLGAEGSEVARREFGGPFARTAFVAPTSGWGQLPRQAGALRFIGGGGSGGVWDVEGRGTTEALQWRTWRWAWRRFRGEQK